MDKTVAVLTIPKLEELLKDIKEDILRDKDTGGLAFVTLDLEQFLFDHARVKIKIDLEKFDEKALSIPLQRTALINEPFQIDIKIVKEKTTGTETEKEKESKDESNGDGEAYGFLGIITDVELDLVQGNHGWMYIYGASRSIKLERGKRLKTFSNKTLEEIVGIVKDGVENLKVTCKPTYETKIKFSMQYYESDYQYLKRTAFVYGQKYFFSGDSLVFGEYAKKEPVTVKYDSEATHVRLHSRLLPNCFINYFHTQEEVIKPCIAKYDMKGTFTDEAGVRSNKLNLEKNIPKLPILAPVYDLNDLATLTKAQKEKNLNRMFTVSGKTKIYKVRIGGLMNIDFDKKLEVDESLGTLLITRVLHHFEQTLIYENEFDACQTTFDYFPCEDVEIPVAQPITATVTNNQDTDGLGKVKLQFDFEEEVCEHWFRCATPDGGGYKVIGKERNRGMIFIPEVEDRVYLNFMEGNPDKPFVAGSFYHGRNAKNLGGGKGNHIRAISDKANNYIQLNSAAGIRVQDQAGNYAHLDGGGNINIRSSETIVLRCGKDGEGSGIMLTKDGLIHLLGNHIIIDAKDNTQTAVAAAPPPLSIFINKDPEVSMALAPDADANGGSGGEPPVKSIDITEAKIDMNSSSSIHVNSDHIAISGSTQTKVDGGGGTIVEESGEVKIN